MKNTLLSFAIAIILVPSISFADTPATSVVDFEAQKIQLMEQIIVLLKTQIEYLVALLGQRHLTPSLPPTTASTTSPTTSPTTTPIVVRKSSGGGGGGGSSSSARREKDAACTLSLLYKDAPTETRVISLNSRNEPNYVWWGLNTTEEVYNYIVKWLRNYEATGGSIYYQYNPDYTYSYAIKDIPILEARLTEYYKNKQLCGVEPAPYTFTPFVAATPTPAFGELIIGASSNNPDPSTLQLKSDANSDWMTVFAFKMDTGSSTRPIMINKLPVTINVTGNDFGSLVNNLKISIDGNLEPFQWVYATGTGTSSSVVVVFDTHGLDIKQADVELKARFEPLITEGATIEASMTPENVLSIDAETYSYQGSSTATVLSGSATGQVQTLRTKGIIGDAGTMSAVLTSAFLPDTHDYVRYTMKVDVTAFGQDVYIAKNSATSLVYGMVDGSGVATSSADTAVDALVSTADTDGSGNYFYVPEGNTETFTVVVTWAPSGAHAAEGFQLLGFNFAETASAPSQVWSASPTNNFRTGVISTSN